jgi:hypothetical protein
LHRLALAFFAFLVDSQERDRRGFFRDVSIQSDDDALATLDGELRGIRGVLNLFLDRARLDGRQCAAGGVDLVDERARVTLDLIRTLLDDPRAAEWIDGVDDAAF